MINYKNIISTQEKIFTTIVNNLFTNVTQDPFNIINLIDPKLELSVANKEYLVSKLTYTVLSYPNLLSFIDSNRIHVKIENIFNGTVLSETEKNLSQKIIEFNNSQENALKNDAEIENYIQSTLVENADIDEANKELKISYGFATEKHSLSISAWALTQENIDIKINNQIVTLIIK